MYLRLVFVLLFFVVLSCKRKEVEPTPVIGGCFIKEVLREDSSQMYKFTYNHSQQLIKYEYWDNNNQLSYYIEYEYGKSDKISKAWYYEYRISNYIIPEYNEQGRIVKKNWYEDGGIYPFHQDSLVYNSAAKLSEIYKFGINDTSGLKEDTSFIQYKYNAEGNLATVIDHSSPLDTGEVSLTLEYGDKLNPYISIADKINLFNTFIVSITQKNNLISYNDYGRQTFVKTLEYNSENFPTRERWDEPSDVYDLIYIYDCK